MGELQDNLGIKNNIYTVKTEKSKFNETQWDPQNTKYTGTVDVPVNNLHNAKQAHDILTKLKSNHYLVKTAEETKKMMQDKVQEDQLQRVQQKLLQTWASSKMLEASTTTTQAVIQREKCACHIVCL